MNLFRKINQDEITIRDLETDDEMRICEDLQEQVWRNSPREVVPHYIFVVVRRLGGQVLGAFEGRRMIGFLLAFPGLHQNQIYLHSHMTAVLPDYQSRGVGTRLKLAQRSHALERGIDLVEWTFDPLQLGNVNFNIVRLGAIVRQYLPNVYGYTTSLLDSGMPTDRLVAEWWIRDTRVEQVLHGREPVASEDSRRVRLPRRIREICAIDPAGARQIQRQLHATLDELFRNSFAITGFELDAEHGTFILEHYEGPIDHGPEFER
jgi:predicted GNAT superfamily acetyltransferase